MYLLGVLIFMFLLIMIPLFSSVSLLTLADPLSLLILLLIVIPVLLLSGYGKDFIYAFKLTATKQKEEDLAKLKRASEAVSLVMKAILYGGAFGSLLGCIALLRQMDDPATIGPYIMAAFVILLYAIVINIMLLPIKAKIDKMIIEYLHE